jgi:hypothetical protein
MQEETSSSPELVGPGARRNVFLISVFEKWERKIAERSRGVARLSFMEKT